MASKRSEFFLGGISPNGFVNHFKKEIEKKENFTYILKGGESIGKSIILKDIADEFKNSDDITVYYCCENSETYDAIKLKNAGVIIVNGTCPHTFDPIYLGVSQKIINLGDYLLSSILEKNADEIIKTYDEVTQWHSRCRSFVGALSSLYTDTYSIALEALDFKKLEAFIERLSHKILPKGKNEEGKTDYAQLSSLTSNGYTSLLSTISSYENVYNISDSFYSGSDTFLREFASIATSKGYDVIISECTLFQSHTYEHLIIPELSIAFISSNPINGIELSSPKIINFQRFYDKDIISQKKQRLFFNKKACDDLLDEAASSLKNAKTVKKKLEGYYSNAINYDKIDKITEDLIMEIRVKY